MYTYVGRIVGYAFVKGGAFWTVDRNALYYVSSISLELKGPFHKPGREINSKELTNIDQQQLFQCDNTVSRCEWKS